MTNEVKINNPNHNYYIGVGRRKNASATVYLKTDGTGKIEIAKRGKKNAKSLDEYFTNSLLYKNKIMKALEILGKKNNCDLKIRVEGGGTTGQLEAIGLGVAKAVLKVSPDYRPTLKAFDLLTRDPRKVEKKKNWLKESPQSFSVFQALILFWGRVIYALDKDLRRKNQTN